MINPLSQQWFEYFEKRIHLEFGMNLKEIHGYQPDVAPLVYCCLRHKMVPVKKREVVLSNKLLCEKLDENKNLSKILKLIENGGDINNYMSKNIKDWKSIDYLLYTLNIRHFHLKKDKHGGILKELVFGVFTDKKFYAIEVGDHNDIYKTKELIKIAKESWPDDIFRYIKIENEEVVEFNSNEFKKFANHPSYQFNLIWPAVIVDGDGISYAMNNHQNTAVVDCTINNINYGKLPFRAWCAYNNEIEYINQIERRIHNEFGQVKSSLEVERKKKIYIVTIHKQKQIKKEIKFQKKAIICSLYDEYN